MLHPALFWLPALARLSQLLSVLLRDTECRFLNKGALAVFNLLPYQLQFTNPCQLLDDRFAPQGAAAVRVAFGVDHLLWLSAPEITRTLVRAAMFIEPALYIGGHPGIQAVVAGFDDIDIPLRQLVLQP